jgi:uncharacterized protein (DUF488 family)
MVRREVQMAEAGVHGESTRLMSIGHSNVSFDAFVELLRAHNVEVVADVRTAPRSRYVPHFDAKPLREALGEAGVKYVFLGRELGGRPDGDEFYDDEDHVLYSRVAESEFFAAGIERLLDGATKFRVAMLCSEEDPLNCHRHLLIGRVLRSRGIEVEHIRGDGTLQTEEGLEQLEAREEPQRALFDSPAEEQSWRSTRSVSRRRAQLSSSEH